MPIAGYSDKIGCHWHAFCYFLIGTIFSKQVNEEIFVQVSAIELAHIAERSRKCQKKIFVQARAEPNLGGRSAERPYCRAQPKMSEENRTF